jgi:hypothetical protein
MKPPNARNSGTKIKRFTSAGNTKMPWKEQIEERKIKMENPLNRPQTDNQKVNHN